MVVSSLSGQHYSQKTPDHLLEDEDETKTKCLPFDLSTCRPVYLSTYMSILTVAIALLFCGFTSNARYGVFFLLLGGSGGLVPKRRVMTRILLMDQM